MSGLQQLRLLVSERLTAAAEEVFGLVEKTITEYQEELVRSRREVIQLRQQIEQLTVLQPRVSLFKEEAQTVLENQDLPPAEEQTETLEHQQVKEEPLEFCTSPDLEADSSEAVGFLRHYSETEPQTESLLLPGDSSITATLNNDTDEECIEGIFSGSSSIGQSCSTASLLQSKKDQIRKPCHICHLSFSSDSLLVQHMAKSHEGHKAFKCPECPKEFARRDYLVQHLRVHTGEKPYMCPYCQKSFRQKSSLKIHKRKHTREKPHRCPFCENFFSQTSNLKVHMRKHTGEKPLFCNSCGKMVSYYSHLKRCRRRFSSATNISGER